MMIAALFIMGTMSVLAVIEAARFQHANRVLGNVDVFVRLLAAETEDDTVDEPFATVIDLTTGRRWATVPKAARPAINTGGTRK